MVNWKVRFSNPKWVVSFISQLLIIMQMLTVGMNQAGLIQFQWSNDINVWVLGVVNAILVALSMLGIVQDPTTKGYSDSERAMSYKDLK